MERITWHFSKIKPSRKNREAMQGEFFSANKNITSSLIREAIQNSLDARLKKAEKLPIKIRIFFSGDQSALEWGDVGPFLSEAWGHYDAEDNGLRNRPHQNERCKFLVIEDFNTTGLDGDICAYTSPVNGSNPFYSFFRAEGQSNKSHTDRGRWGVGKYVFPKASRIKSFFGYTIRDEDQKQCLVGQTILKSHRVNGSAYTPDGWYGWKKQIQLEDDYDDLHMPADYEMNPDIIDLFRDTFKVTRKTESGLSIVIPYVDEEVDCDDIIKAVLYDYFWPILTGDLFVSVECQNSIYAIEAGSLSEMCSRYEDDQSVEMKTQIDLAKWATAADNNEYTIINMPAKTSPPKWTEQLIESEMQVMLRKKLEKEDKIAIRVPITIRSKEGDDAGEETYFNIFLQRNSEAKIGSPVFIREGIIIPDVRCQKTPRTVALLVADDPVIADFLGNAENPAHTDWHHNSENFRGKYVYDHQTLRFIKNSIPNIIKIIDESSKQEDRTLLLDFFSIPVPSEGPKRQSKKQKDKEPGDTSDIPPDIPEGKPKRYKVNKVMGGFSISKGDKSISLPATLDIKVFYDRRGGKARYNINDFRIEKRPIKIDTKGLKLIQTKGNRLIAEVLNQDFHLTVKGFDLKRDLLVKPTISELEDEDATI